MKTTKADLIKALQTALLILGTENVRCVYEYGESESLFEVYPEEMKLLALYAKEFLTGREFNKSTFSYILNLF